MRLIFDFGLIATLLSTAASAAPSQATIQTCQEIARALPPRRVFYPGSTTYTAESTNYWSATLSATRPACMVMPLSATEVSTFVKMIAARPDIKYAVKSGGHSPNLGWATADEGVLLSLANMKGAEYDAEKNVAYVAPGGHWKDVIADLAPFNKTVVGGRLDMVGVGGYLLGGGVSFLSSQYGMAGDTVMDFETVMANGSIVNINAQSYPDLLVAMRGGGNQFGIVTKFTMKAVPMGRVWGGPIMFSDSNRRAILTAFHDFTANPVDPKASVIVSLSRFGGSGTLWVIHRFYDGEVPPKGAFMGFEDLWHIPGTDFGAVRTYADLLTIDSTGGDILALGRTGLRAMTLPLLPGAEGINALSETVQAWYNSFQPYQETNTFSDASIALQSFPSSIGKAGMATSGGSGNALGLTSNDQPRVMIEFATIHNAPSSDRLAAEAGHDASLRIAGLWSQHMGNVLAIDPEAKVERNLPLSLNHAAWDQDVYSTYPGFVKFRGLQRMVDPDGVWRRTGGFKFRDD